jgi:tRNA(Ile)-lysidine synthase
VEKRAGRPRAADPVLRALRLACGQEELLPAGAKVLAACSGGADSVALAAGLTELLGEPARTDLVLGHVDHGLRPQARAEAESVRGLALRLGVPFALARLDGAALEQRGRQMGLEAAAREARYLALARLANEHGAAFIATAHTRRDQAETVLLRLSRGGGLGALAGIRQRRPLDPGQVEGRGLQLVRPLLGVGREETEAFCRERGLAFTDDPHNRDPRFGRSRLRKGFGALDRLLGPGLEKALARAASLAAADEALLAHLAQEALRDCSGDGAKTGRLDARKVQALPLALQRRVLAGAAAEAGLAPTLSQVDALIPLLGHARATLSLPGGRAQVEARRLRFVPGRIQPLAPALLPVAVPGPGRYTLGAMNLSLSSQPSTQALRVELSSAPLPWTLRCAAPGDRFRPAKGRSKKVSELWIDAKVPKAERAALALLCDASGAPFLVERLRPGAAVTGSTNPQGGPALYLTLSREDAG